MLWEKEMGLQGGRTLGPEGVFARLEERGCFEHQGLKAGREQGQDRGQKETRLLWPQL